MTFRSQFARRLATDIVLVLACFAILPTVAGAADSAETLERRVKAAFLYQFAGYAEWPAESFEQAGTPVTIAVAGAEPMAAELTQVVSGRTVGGRTITVKRLKTGEPLTGIHILFVGVAENARLAQFLQASHAHPILMVTESDGSLARGSMINFVIDDRRVRFEVALDTVEKGGLKLSSRLLAVARDVKTAGGK